MKNVNSFLLMICICLIFTATMCSELDPNGHEFIVVENLSDRDIFLIEKNERDIIPSDTLYECYTSGWHGVIKPNTSIEISSSHDSWELDFKYSPCFQFFIFSEKPPLFECDKDSIRAFMEKNLLKRYQMVKQDMEDGNWTITYP